MRRSSNGSRSASPRTSVTRAASSGSRASRAPAPDSICSLWSSATTSVAPRRTSSSATMPGAGRDVEQSLAGPRRDRARPSPGASADPARSSSARRSGRSAAGSPSNSSSACRLRADKVNLPGVERGPAALGQSPSAGLRRRSPPPGPLPPPTGPARPASASRPRSASSTCSGDASSHRSRRWSSRASVGSTASRSSPIVPRRRRSSGGNVLGPTATFSPIPSTAHPSWGRPSTRIPASLRPSTSTSLGHFTRASGPTTSATATPAASGSSRGGSRTTSERGSPTRAERSRCGPAARVRPSARPPSPACRAERRAAASSRARSLVESVTPRCTRGRAEELTAPALMPPRSGALRRRRSRAARRRCRG